MRNLQEVTERICDLKGSLVALDALLSAMLARLPPAERAGLADAFRDHAEVARNVLLHADNSESALTSFERDVGRAALLLDDAAPGTPAPGPDAPVGPA